MQKEVAERMVAEAGDLSILAIATQILCSGQIGGSSSARILHTAAKSWFAGRNPENQKAKFLEEFNQKLVPI